MIYVWIIRCIRLCFITVIKETVIFNCSYVLGMCIVLCNCLFMGNVYLLIVVSNIFLFYLLFRLIKCQKFLGSENLKTEFLPKLLLWIMHTKIGYGAWCKYYVMITQKVEQKRTCRQAM
jgi:hypothetical protein